MMMVAMMKEILVMVMGNYDCHIMINNNYNNNNNDNNNNNNNNNTL